MGKLSRTKGATFERWVAKQLKPIFPDAHRQPQAQIKLLKEIAVKNPDIPQPCLTDVVAGPLGIECKHRKVLPKFEATLAQAEGDIGGSGKLAVALHKSHGGGIEVAMRSSTLRTLSPLKPKLSARNMLGGHPDADDLHVLEWEDFLCLLDSYAHRN